MSGEVTLKDIALRAGVSTAAISQALNDRGNLKAETRERIKAIATDLGYIPNKYATALRRGRTMSVAFVMADDTDADDSKRRAVHRTRQIGGLVREAATNGFTVTVIPESRPDLLGGAHVDIAYFSEADATSEVLREAAARGIPVVTNDLYVDAVRGVSIRTGYDQAVRAALEVLAAGGAERIGFLVDEDPAPRDEIGETAYRVWSTVQGREPVIARVDAGRVHLARRLRELLDGGADAILSFCEEGPTIDLYLEATELVIPRDIQFVALCTTDCAVNVRLGVTHVCMHPELAPAAMFEALGAAQESTDPLVVDLPWELVRGSSTR